MAVKDIQNYIAANQGKYPREVLIAELRKNGYPEGEIQAALRGHDAQQTGDKPQSIWTKIGWWVLGLIAGWAVFFPGVWLLIMLLGELFDYVGFLMALAAGVALDLFIYFRSRKRLKYFARGVLTGLIAGAAIVIVFIVLLVSLFGGGLIPFL